jgi:hypothetical protein
MTEAAAKIRILWTTILGQSEHHVNLAAAGSFDSYTGVQRLR